MDLLFAGAKLPGMLFLEIVELGQVVLSHILAELIALEFSELLGFDYF